MEIYKILEPLFSALISSVAVSLSALAYIHAKFVTKREFDTHLDNEKDYHAQSLQKMIRIEDKLDALQEKLFTNRPRD